MYARERRFNPDHELPNRFSFNTRRSGTGLVLILLFYHFIRAGTCIMAEPSSNGSHCNELLCTHNRENTISITDARRCRSQPYTLVVSFETRYRFPRTRPTSERRKRGARAERKQKNSIGSCTPRTRTVQAAYNLIYPHSTSLHVGH